MRWCRHVLQTCPADISWSLGLFTSSLHGGLALQLQCLPNALPPRRAAATLLLHKNIAPVLHNSVPSHAAKAGASSLPYNRPHRFRESERKRKRERKRCSKKSRERERAGAGANRRAREQERKEKRKEENAFLYKLLF